VQYGKQLTEKHEMVVQAIQRIGKIRVKEWHPILPAVETYYYRNKLEFSFSNKTWLTFEEKNAGVSAFKNVLGFHKSGAFDKVLQIEECHLMHETHNEIRNTIRAIAQQQHLPFFDAREKAGFLRHITVRVSTLGEIFVIITFYFEHEEKRTAFLDAVHKALPQITTLFYCINSKANDINLDQEILVYKGPGYIQEALGEVRFRIGPKSFFQTNTRQAVRLFEVVRSFAGLTGQECVYDLYTGIGSIGLYLARSCKKMVGIEEVAMAIDDARENAALNDLKNTVWYAGDVRAILTEEFAITHGKPDVVITDPPRAGMHADVVKMLLELASPKIVYVSCKPASQARDLALLGKKYRVLKVQPVDMFPQTHHVETVALLALKSAFKNTAWKRFLKKRLNPGYTQ
jgi:23S rRNA (uracil1939-C5)-methyltransferase